MDQPTDSTTISAVPNFVTYYLKSKLPPAVTLLLIALFCGCSSTAVTLTNVSLDIASEAMFITKIYEKGGALSCIGIA